MHKLEAFVPDIATKDRINSIFTMYVTSIRKLCEGYLCITILLKAFLATIFYKMTISKFYPLQKIIHWSIHSDTLIYWWSSTHFAVSIHVWKHYALRYTDTSLYCPISSRHIIQLILYLKTRHKFLCYQIHQLLVLL